MTKKAKKTKDNGVFTQALYTLEKLFSGDSFYFIFPEGKVVVPYKRESSSLRRKLLEGIVKGIRANNSPLSYIGIFEYIRANYSITEISKSTKGEIKEYSKVIRHVLGETTINAKGEGKLYRKEIGATFKLEDAKYSVIYN